MTATRRIAWLTDPVECDTCGFYTRLPCDATRKNGDRLWAVKVCQLCAHTRVGTALLNGQLRDTEHGLLLAQGQFSTNLLGVAQFSEMQWVLRIIDVTTDEVVTVKFEDPAS